MFPDVYTNLPETTMTLVICCAACIIQCVYTWLCRKNEEGEQAERRKQSQEECGPLALSTNLGIAGTYRHCGSYTDEASDFGLQCRRPLEMNLSHC